MFVTEKDLPDIPEGQYYVRDLIGNGGNACRRFVTAIEAGEYLSIEPMLFKRRTADLFEVELEVTERKVLIPKVAEFVIDINEIKSLQ